MTYYHVTTSRYDDGDDLLCWSRYVERYGEEPGAWKWDDEDVDTDLVCLFETIEEAQEFAATFVDDPVLLIVDLDDEVSTIRNDEGYVAVVGSIPARCIRRA